VRIGNAHGSEFTGDPGGASERIALKRAGVAVGALTAAEPVPHPVATVAPFVSRRSSQALGTAGTYPVVGVGVLLDSSR
jgi:hypothetical protein